MRLLLTALLFQLVIPAWACTLRLAPEEWPPYFYHNDKAVLTGVDYDLLVAILSHAGCALQVEKEMPPARRNVLFQQGKLDLLMAASLTEERRGYARFSLPYRQETVGLFTLPEKLDKFRRIDSFQGIVAQRVSLLAPRLGYYGDDYERALPLLNAEGRRSTFGTFEQGIKMLEAGRGDLIMGDANALRHIARAQNVKIAPLAYIPYRAPVHIMLNAASTTQAQLTRINHAIAQLEQNGALAAIRARYGVN
ncbi:substrate-binding periplasmic protein [Pseudoduganella violaceinigra]|uniref:substrate-binding periplasmic protein n=1 Tax=Pseudoduganella violaceinigra TaxID=246602 RepID=UPI000550D783|nr:transporter substrate-binding domain-containing protein [Pseudoduganella violaceinigra]